MSTVRSIRPLAGHTANGWPESLSKPLCSKTSLHTAVSQGPSRALLEELQETVRGEDEEECLRASCQSCEIPGPALCCFWCFRRPHPRKVLSTLLLPSLLRNSLPMVGVSPLPRPEQSQRRAWCQQGRKTEGSGGRPCSRWAQKHAGASCPALRI